MERPAVEEVVRLVSSDSESNADLAGRRLGVYHIEARIGSGGMSVTSAIVPPSAS